MRRTLQLSPIASLTPFLSDGDMMAFNVGPDGTVYLVIALCPVDYYEESPGWAKFPRSIPEQPQRYRVVGLAGSETVLDMIVENEPFNIHNIQPLGDEILLICARSYYHSADNIEKNGRVYSRDGQFIREILLGDGIRGVQTSGDATIWTAFFDEGVFGNYGWKDPIGAMGLVAQNYSGEVIYRFQPGRDLDHISDCYALNVETDNDTWLYYYTPFPLVRLRNFQIDSVWQIPLRGAGEFAVAPGYALFTAEYGIQDEYTLFGLRDGGKVKRVAKMALIDQDGVKLQAQRTVGRGSSLYIISNDYLYRMDVQAAIECRVYQ